MSGDREYLRAGDIAALTGMSIRTVRRWIANESLPSTKLGGTRFVAKADLEHLLSPFPEPTQAQDDGIEEYDGSSFSGLSRTRRFETRPHKFSEV